MDLGQYVDEIRDQLVVAADAGGDEARALADRLVAPLDAAVRLALQNALAAAADEITVELAPGSVELRVRGRDLAFVVTPPADANASDEEPEETAHAALDTDDGGVARINVRMPEHLKARVEQAAGAEQLSVNAWLVRAASSALERADARPARRTKRCKRHAALQGLGEVMERIPMKTFQTPEPIAVVVEVSVADVVVTTSDRTDTVVEITPTNHERKGDVEAAQQTTVEFNDGVVTIKGPKGWRHMTPWRGRESIDITVEAPSGTKLRGSFGAATFRSTGRVGECRCKSGAGSVHVDEAGPVSVSLGAGDVKIGRAAGDVDVKIAGAIRIGTIDGSAVIKNSNGDTSIHEITGDLRVSAANGDVVVDRAHATVVAKSANGDIRLDNAEGGAIVAETARGQVEVGIREGVAAFLDLTTAHGRVRNDLDDAGPPAAGEDALDVRARTAFGDITIRRTVA